MAHPSEGLRVQSQLHREPKGEIVHCETAHGWRSHSSQRGLQGHGLQFGCPNGYRSEMANCISASPALETLCGSAPFAPLVKVGEELVVEGGSTLCKDLLVGLPRFKHGLRLWGTNFLHFVRQPGHVKLCGDPRFDF